MEQDGWKDEAFAAIALGSGNPDFVPRYRIPARRWWQIWKPRWQWIEGVSRNQIRRAHGLAKEQA